MTSAQPSPTPVQVLAAQVRIKADKRLRRETPPEIRKIAEYRPSDRPAGPA